MDVQFAGFGAHLIQEARITLQYQVEILHPSDPDGLAANAHFQHHTHREVKQS